MDWMRGPVIGRGSSGTVSLAMSLSGGGGVFAVKSAPLSESDPLQREQGILSSLCSPYLVGYKGYAVSQELTFNYNLFMEYVPGGTLADVAGKVDDEATIRYYTWRILMGLEYLHSMGIVHCDIKPRNILIAPDGPKIADLGCARSVSPTAIAGTPMYMSPEAARGEEQGFAADVWSVGCTVAELATGRAPWEGCSGDPMAALYKIGYSSESPEIPAFLSEEAKDFLGKCLRRDPKERWTADELLQHPFMVGAGEIEVSESKKWVFSSPTCTLEQGIWNSSQSSLSLSSSSYDTTYTGEGSEDRIRKFTALNGEPRWELEEDWITIRTGEMLIL